MVWFRGFRRRCSLPASGPPALNLGAGGYQGFGLPTLLSFLHGIVLDSRASESVVGSKVIRSGPHLNAQCLM